MNGILLRLLALAPLPLIGFLIIWTGSRPETATLVLKSHGTRVSPARSVSDSLPRDLKSGWSVQGKVERYDEKTLFDRIDGAAPAYIRAGFEYSLGVEYRKEEFKEPVVVDVYCMGSPARALGMYATERDPSYTFIEMGQEGYLASGSLNWWQGKFYIKLAGYEEGVESGLKELAADLAEALPSDTGTELAPLKLLPVAGQRPHSLGYSHTPLGDVDGLERVFYASYGEGEQVYRLFVAPSNAAARYQKVKAYFAKDGAKIQEADGMMHIAGDSTTSLVRQQGELLAGVIDLTRASLIPEARAKLTEIKP